MKRFRNKVAMTHWKLFLEMRCFLIFKQKRKITYDFSKSLKNNCAGNLKTYFQFL